MRGMRNIAAHEYFGLDLETVWQTATCDVPVLRPLLERLLVKYVSAARGQNGVRLVILNREPTDLDDLAEVVLNLEIGRTLGEAVRAE